MELHQQHAQCQQLSGSERDRFDQRTNATYALLYAFDPGLAWLEERQNQLDAYRQQGLGDNSREVVSETLNVWGLNWMLQTEWSTFGDDYRANGCTARIL